MAYTVKVVADLAGVSIRTLHHYDDIGLLKPAQVSAAGYRLYTESDLERLQQILFFRELGFGLPEIRAALDTPGFDRKKALVAHKKALLERQERVERLIQTIDHTLETMERGTRMDDKELKDLFDGFDHTQYEEEARQRWGGSKEYEESVRRTKKYTKQDWEAIKAETGAIAPAIAELMDLGPADPQVQEWVRKWHEAINKWFYTCSLEVFRGLGQMYVADYRFAENYEKVKPGLAQFMCDAMGIYCDKLEGKA